MEAVTAVLAERATDVRGLRRTIVLSIVGHAVLAAVLLVWAGRASDTVTDDLRPVMTVSLGGAPGPRAGGMTMMGRPFQATAPLPEVAKPAPVRRPVDTAPPAMVLPDPRTRPSRTPPARPSREAAAATQRPAPGEPPAGTGAAQAGGEANPLRGLGFGGLSTGGGGGAGGYLDVKNFCCPDYLVTMVQVIQRNWNSRQEVNGQTLVTFRIQRDGRITDIELERSSGYAALDLTAQRALFLTQRVPVLPAAFPDDHLTIHLWFQYFR